MCNTNNTPLVHQAHITCNTCHPKAEGGLRQEDLEAFRYAEKMAVQFDQAQFSGEEFLGESEWILENETMARLMKIAAASLWRSATPAQRKWAERSRAFALREVAEDILARTTRTDLNPDLKR